MSKFKAGDLALIVGANWRFETIGRCVELLEPTINSFGEPGWIWDGCVSPKGTLERHLMPLRGDFQPEQQKSQEVPA